MTTTRLRPSGVRPALGLVLLAGALFVAGRTSGAGWVVVMMCGLVGLAVVGVLWPAVTALRVGAEVVESPRDGTVGMPARFTVRAGPGRSGVRLRLSAAGAEPPSDVAVWGPCVAAGPVIVVPTHRGVYERVTVTVDVQGPLGLCGWRRRFETELAAPFVVGPHPEQMNRDELGRLQRAPDAAGPGRGIAAGHEMFRGPRTYRAGDPLRLVHWPATARAGRPMVRELEGDAAPELHMVVDLRGSPDAAERAASRAAGLGRSALGEGRRVVLHTAEEGGACEGEVRSAEDLGRRLAYAVSDAAPLWPPGVDAVVVRAQEEPPRAAGPSEVAPKPTALRRLARINARQPAEEDWPVRAAAFVAVMTAALAVLAQSVGGPGLRLLVLAGIPIGFLFAWWSRHRPGHVTKLVVALGAVLGLMWFLRTLSGITGGTVADAQTPLAELVLLVQVLQTFDATASRDLRFSVLVSVVVMAAAGLLSISPGLLAYLVVWAVAAVQTMVLTHRSALARLPALAVPDRHGVGARAGRRRGAGLHTGAVLASALVAGLGLFVLVPAAGAAQALVFPAAIARIVPEPGDGGLDNPSLGSGNPAGRFSAEVRAGRRVPAGRLPFGYFGFSDVLDLAARGRPDNTLVMRVRASHPAMWMGQAFDVWNGRRWVMSSQRTVPIGGGLPLDVVPPAEQGGGAATGPAFVQTYYVIQPGANLVFAADPAVQVYLPAGHLDELSDGTMRSSVELGPGAVYTVVSRPALVTAATLRRAGPADLVPPSISRRYGQPPTTTARVRKLARDVTAGVPTTYDKVLALESWIGAHTRYSLRPPALPAGADAVDRFLFVDREGFCEQIATSLVVMLRSLGVPSRLAVGYAGGTRDPLTGVFDVHASDAHAWAEVWFPGVGWQPFDPTARVPLAGDAGISAAAGLWSYIDARLPSVPAPAAAGAGGLAAAGLAGVGTRALLRSRRRRTTGAAPVPEPSWAASCQTRLEAAAASVARPRREGETIQEYVSAVSGSIGDELELGVLADLIDRAAFSAGTVADAERSWSGELLARIEREACQQPSA